MKVSIPIVEDSYNSIVPDGLELVFEIPELANYVVVKIGDTEREVTVHRSALAKVLEVL